MRFLNFAGVHIVNDVALADFKEKIVSWKDFPFLCLYVCPSICLSGLSRVYFVLSRPFLASKISLFCSIFSLFSG